MKRLLWGFLLLLGVESISYRCENNQVLIVQNFGNDTIRMHCQRLNICGFDNLNCEYEHQQHTCGGKYNFVAHVNQGTTTGPVEHTCCLLKQKEEHPSYDNDCFVYELPDGSHAGDKKNSTKNDDGITVLKNANQIPEQFDGYVGYRMRLFMLRNKSPPTLIVKAIERVPAGYRVTICRPRCGKFANEGVGEQITVTKEQDTKVPEGDDEWAAAAWSSWQTSTWSTWSKTTWSAWEEASGENSSGVRTRGHRVGHDSESSGPLATAAASAKAENGQDAKASANGNGGQAPIINNHIHVNAEGGKGGEGGHATIHLPEGRTTDNNGIAADGRSGRFGPAHSDSDLGGDGWNFTPDEETHGKRRGKKPKNGRKHSKYGDDDENDDDLTDDADKSEELSGNKKDNKTRNKDSESENAGETSNVSKKRKGDKSPSGKGADKSDKKHGKDEDDNGDDDNNGDDSDANTVAGDDGNNGKDGEDGHGKSDSDSEAPKPGAKNQKKGKSNKKKPQSTGNSKTVHGKDGKDGKDGVDSDGGDAQKADTDDEDANKPDTDAEEEGGYGKRKNGKNGKNGKDNGKNGKDGQDGADADSNGDNDKKAKPSKHGKGNGKNGGKSGAKKPKESGNGEEDANKEAGKAKDREQDGSNGANDGANDAATNGDKDGADHRPADGKNGKNSAKKSPKKAGKTGAKSTGIDKKNDGENDGKDDGKNGQDGAVDGNDAAKNGQKNGGKDGSTKGKKDNKKPAKTEGKKKDSEDSDAGDDNANKNDKLNKGDKDTKTKKPGNDKNKKNQKAATEKTHDGESDDKKHGKDSDAAKKHGDGANAGKKKGSESDAKSKFKVDGGKDSEALKKKGRLQTHDEFQPGPEDGDDDSSETIKWDSTEADKNSEEKDGGKDGDSDKSTTTEAQEKKSETAEGKATGDGEATGEAGANGNGKADSDGEKTADGETEGKPKDSDEDDTTDETTLASGGKRNQVAGHDAGDSDLKQIGTDGGFKQGGDDSEAKSSEPGNSAEKTSDAKKEGDSQEKANDGEGEKSREGSRYAGIIRETKPDSSESAEKDSLESTSPASETTSEGGFVVEVNAGVGTKSGEHSSEEAEHTLQHSGSGDSEHSGSGDSEHGDGGSSGGGSLPYCDELDEIAADASGEELSGSSGEGSGEGQRVSEASGNTEGTTESSQIATENGATEAGSDSTESATVAANEDDAPVTSQTSQESSEATPESSGTPQETLGTGFAGIITESSGEEEGSAVEQGSGEQLLKTTVTTKKCRNRPAPKKKNNKKKRKHGRRGRIHSAKQHTPPRDPNVLQWQDSNGPEGFANPMRSCFSGDTLVRTVTGDKPMSELQVGDYVLVPSGDNTMKYEKVELFYHREPETTVKFIQLNTESGKTLSLTQLHLLPFGDCEEMEESIQKGDDTDEWIRKSKFSYKAQQGQCVLSLDSEGRVTADKIVKVGRRYSKGIYSPVTVEGAIVTNDILSSCFSQLESHSAQKMAFDLLIRIYNVFGYLKGAMHHTVQDVPIMLDYVHKLSWHVLPFAKY
ncbi:unnamed protein product [Bursaphelenchus okinawaensis]|uniref:Hint domain-containing protein n=1 Tax=Bursaphelenchus okinawaensis TaxID=465554 RepID=A0A811KAY0_9BILA|nr:unnamed protein product [Bursaphelenchus okinawaensis]CAG9095075.1 unnamed protein product [Bursaphelenchus okinawaensis]